MPDLKKQLLRCLEELPVFICHLTDKYNPQIILPKKSKQKLNYRLQLLSGDKFRREDFH